MSRFSFRSPRIQFDGMLGVVMMDSIRPIAFGMHVFRDDHHRVEECLTEEITKWMSRSRYLEDEVQDALSELKKCIGESEGIIACWSVLHF